MFEYTLENPKFTLHQYLARSKHDVFARPIPNLYRYPLVWKIYYPDS